MWDFFLFGGRDGLWGSLTRLTATQKGAASAAAPDGSFASDSLLPPCLMRALIYVSALRYSSSKSWLPKLDVKFFTIPFASCCKVAMVGLQVPLSIRLMLDCRFPLRCATMHNCTSHNTESPYFKLYFGRCQKRSRRTVLRPCNTNHHCAFLCLFHSHLLLPRLH